MPHIFIRKSWFGKMKLLKFLSSFNAASCLCKLSRRFARGLIKCQILHMHVHKDIQAIYHVKFVSILVYKTNCNCVMRRLVNGIRWKSIICQLIPNMLV